MCDKNKTSKFLRGMLIFFGTLFLCIGIIGVFIPLLPTTPFLLLAAACYARGSDRFYNWLLCNKYLGNYIKNYREGKGIALSVKIITLFLLWATILFSVVFIVPIFIIRIVLIIIATAVTLHIISIKSITILS
ncbi:MAG: hypothetical protein APG12_01131 [Candidatus Methanofastidiosum methylothiophilum]|uniref:Inner membrane protein YbaN n=1 Tax=Candidatus Methanofastidiosum methylothiophilum TaxID=1705564 RepID=A0A150IJC9_9EURY|nr:MAG: hypothetical protein APG10_01132 [Candidatus Methanofastidiosum methylthiophilus]KYC47173.1 MAG: hypothetical protein APG11_01382 [Candidatus Methanofastidiosum methylthiophilus]KYC49957.1 MAG: hypothetical protein APG12_01131 [Candidatus Methanofastidiosum methylthiophilus]